MYYYSDFVPHLRCSLYASVVFYAKWVQWHPLYNGDCSHTLSDASVCSQVYVTASTVSLSDIVGVLVCANVLFGVCTVEKSHNDVFPRNILLQLMLNCVCVI